VIGYILFFVIHLNIFEDDIDEFESDEFLHHRIVNFIEIVANHIHRIHEDRQSSNFQKKGHRVTVFQFIDRGGEVGK
jgi:hypothetical protein